MVDPVVSGRDQQFEWVELWNSTAFGISLAGWSLGDNAEADPLPPLTIPAFGFALIAGSPQAVPEVPAGVWMVLPEDGTIGNGLANTGDRLVLKDGAGRVVDALSWGSDASVNQPPCPASRTGRSLQRIGSSSGSQCRFQENPSPSPGLPNIPVPSPTPNVPTPTAVPTPAGMTHGTFFPAVSKRG